MAKTTKDIIYLEQLFSREAHELYQDENLLADAFGQFREVASNPVLSDLLEHARRETLDVASSIKEHLSGTPGKSRKPALRHLLDDGHHLVGRLGNNHLVDAQLISSLQRLLGYQLAGYETVRNYARMMREDALESILSRAHEQKQTLARQLSEVAVHQVHWRANWWAPEHTSAWDRVKAAFRRDWEQTKAHMGAAPPLPDGEQKAGDTVAQISGKQEVVPGTFEANEPAFRYGYGAAHYYHDRDWSPELEDELRTNYGGFWESARDNIRAGWDYARPHATEAQADEHAPARTRRVIILDDEGQRLA